MTIKGLYIVNCMSLAEKHYYVSAFSMEEALKKVIKIGEKEKWLPPIESNIYKIEYIGNIDLYE